MVKVDRFKPKVGEIYLEILNKAYKLPGISCYRIVLTNDLTGTHSVKSIFTTGSVAFAEERFSTFMVDSWVRDGSMKLFRLEENELETVKVIYS